MGALYDGATQKNGRLGKIAAVVATVQPKAAIFDEIEDTPALLVSGGRKHTENIACKRSDAGQLI